MRHKDMLIDKMNEEAAYFDDRRGKIILDEDFKDMIKGFQQDFNKPKRK